MLEIAEFPPSPILSHQARAKAIFILASLGIYLQVELAIFIYTKRMSDRSRVELAVMDKFEDQAIQDELEILWGDRLNSLTPKQRKMVAEILRQAKRDDRDRQIFNHSSNRAASQIGSYSYGCY